MKLETVTFDQVTWGQVVEQLTRAAADPAVIPDDVLPLHSVVWWGDRLPPTAVAIKISRQRQIFVLGYVWPEIDDGAPGKLQFQCRLGRLKQDRPQAALAMRAGQLLLAHIEDGRGAASAVPAEIDINGKRSYKRPTKPVEYAMIGGCGVTKRIYNPFGQSWPIE